MNRPAKTFYAVIWHKDSRPVNNPFILLALFLLGLAPQLATAQDNAQPLVTEAHNTLNQIIVRWESNAETPFKTYSLYRSPEGSDDWEEVVSCEYFAEQTFYAYRDQEVGKHDQINYRLEAQKIDGSTVRLGSTSASMTPYQQRLSYAVDMERQTISFYGGFLSQGSEITLMDLQGSRFSFPTALVDDRLTMDAIELPNGQYTYTVSSGNKRRSGNVQYDRQLLEEVPGAFAFSPSRDE